MSAFIRGVFLRCESIRIRLFSSSTLYFFLFLFVSCFLFPYSFNQQLRMDGKSYYSFYFYEIFLHRLGPNLRANETKEKRTFLKSLCSPDVDVNFGPSMQCARRENFPFMFGYINNKFTTCSLVEKHSHVVMHVVKAVLML